MFAKATSEPSVDRKHILEIAAESWHSLPYPGTVPVTFHFQTVMAVLGTWWAPTHAHTPSHSHVDRAGGLEV